MPRFSLYDNPSMGGTPLSVISASYPQTLDQFYGMGNYPAEWNQTGMRWGDVVASLEIITLAHLGYDLHGTDALHFAKMGVEIAVDYFYGEYTEREEYKESMRRSVDNEFLMWSGLFHDGLFLATLMQDMASAKKLCSWVAPWLPFDDSEYNFSKQAIAYLKLLAAVVDERRDDIAPLSKEIDQARPKRWKYLRDGILAINQMDATAFAESMHLFLKHYLKSDLGKEYVTCWVSLDASTLWNLAIVKNLQLPDLDERSAALIVTRDTLTEQNTGAD